jgi:hypothetical protein
MSWVICQVPYKVGMGIFEIGEERERETIEWKAPAVGAGIVVVWPGSTWMICCRVMQLEVILHAGNI